MRIRLVEPADAEPIRQIYNYEVRNATTTFDLVARSAAEQRAWVARHRGAHPAIVAVDEPPPAHDGLVGSGLPPAAGAVMGFAVISPYRDRAAYGTSVEDSVYVHRDQRGRGVGRALLDELLLLAAAHGFHTVVARISSENEPSIRLHRSCGFVVVGTEREIGRKHGRWLDVVELQHML